MEHVSNKELFSTSGAEKDVHDLMVLGIKPTRKFKVLPKWVMPTINIVLLSLWWGAVVLLIANAIAE